MSNQRHLDPAEQLELEEWQQHDRSKKRVLADIEYYIEQRKKFADKAWYDMRIDFLEWLIKQPRLPEE